ncbi:MAG TPA: hypothetical protein VM366_13855 [Anaerolineae bacterium]|nr:hypothetical protein [Anaerolineae bacterium]
MERERKQIHVNLWGNEQIADYEFARQITGITNDNDLLRHLLRQFRLNRQKPANVLVDTPSSYHTEPVPEEA